MQQLPPPPVADPAGVKSLVEAAVNMCRRIAPVDLKGPLYVVPMSQVPADLGGAASCLGLASADLDVILRGVIGPSWRGRGPCVLVSDAVGRRRFLKVTVHELSHVLEIEQVYTPVDSLAADSIRDRARPMLDRMAGPPATWHSPADARRMHGPAFFRTCLHAVYRANQLGYGLNPERVVAWPFGPRSPVRCYYDALDGECERQAGQPFSAIRATAVPTALTDLWEADAARVRGDATAPSA